MKVLRIIGIVLGVIVALIVLAVVGVFAASEVRLNQTFTVPADKLNIAISNDAATVERGRYLASAVGACADCHDQDMGGRAMSIDPSIASLYGSNLTSGKGRVGNVYEAADFVRALRYGVKKDGKAILGMPVLDYHKFNDQDLGAIVAYLQSLPPVDRETPGRNLSLLGRALFMAGAFGPLPPEAINPNASTNRIPPTEDPVERGNYIASIACTGCHGPSYSGGTVPASPPDAPAAKNLTPGGQLAGWSEADFIKALRTGVTPGGQQLNVQWMPYNNLGKMTDDDLKAVYAYLKSLPPKAFGEK